MLVRKYLPGILGEEAGEIFNVRWLVALRISGAHLAFESGLSPHS
jgi:hypothetical protein